MIFRWLQKENPDWEAGILPLNYARKRGFALLKADALHYLSPGSRIKPSHRIVGIIPGAAAWQRHLDSGFRSFGTPQTGIPGGTQHRQATCDVWCMKILSILAFSVRDNLRNSGGLGGRWFFLCGQSRARSDESRRAGVGIRRRRPTVSLSDFRVSERPRSGGRGGSNRGMGTVVRGSCA